MVKTSTFFLWSSCSSPALVAMAAPANSSSSTAITCLPFHCYIYIKIKYKHINAKKKCTYIHITRIYMGASAVWGLGYGILLHRLHRIGFRSRALCDEMNIRPYLMQYG